MKKTMSMLLILTLLCTMCFSAPATAFAAGEKTDEADTQSFVEDEVLVVFKDDATQKEKKEIAEDLDAEKMEEIETPAEETPCVVTLPAGESVKAAVKELAGESEVAYAQPNYLYTLDDDAVSGAASKASAKKSGDMDLWNLKKIDAQEAWNLIDDINKDGKKREKVTVAVLDTGVNLKHEDLQEALAKDKCVNVIDTDTPPYPTITPEAPENWPAGKNYYNGDPEGHGTKVSGVIAATNDNKGITGVAAGNNNEIVELAAVGVSQDTSDGRLATCADLVKGINYACDTIGAKVINMSIGHYQGETAENSDTLLEGGQPVLGTDALLESTIDTAVQKGTTVVCSAGNKNNTVTWLPSDFSNTISVISTTNYTDVYENCKAPSSSYGPKKDISAPGYMVSTTDHNGGYNYNSSSGTSFAAPTVAAVAAMLYYVEPTNMTPAKVKEILTSTATDLYTYGDDIYTRCGNVNAHAAVAKAAGRPAPQTGKLTTPSNLRASSAGYNSIKLNWNTVPGVKGYQIYRSTSASGTFTRVATISGSGNSSYVNSGLSAGTGYYYKIRTYGTLDDKRAYSANSPVVKATPVPATVTGFSASDSTYRSIKLKWKRVSGASGYTLYRATSKNGKYKNFKSLTKGTATSYTTTTGITAGKTYYYKMRAYRTVSGKRVYGSYSKVDSARPAPRKPGLRVTKYASRSAKVKWSKVASIDGYVIARSTSKNGKYKRIRNKSARSSRYLIDKKLKKKKNYYYKVRAYKRVRGKTIYGSYTAPKQIRL